jgi:hypothetical protein
MIAQYPAEMVRTTAGLHRHHATSRAEIYQLIETMPANGLGVILVSSDLIEVIGAPA